MDSTKLLKKYPVSQLTKMLTKFTKKFRDAKIVRTRDPKLLETFDIVVDVGGVYDPSKGLFDHH